VNRREFFLYSVGTGLAACAGMRLHRGEKYAQAKADQRKGEGSAMNSRWIRPGAEEKRPIWGLRDGIQVGLWPASLEGEGDGGPRGLLRIGYPILDGGKRIGLLNFIAIEPSVNGRRGFSELERSTSDGKPGIQFWTGPADKPTDVPDPGTLRAVDGVETLSVTVRTERFGNGARPIVALEIRADRPGELRLTVTSAPGSAPMETCVLTATMGNYARLRRLWLRDEVVEAKKVWPDFDGNEFTEDAFFAQERLVRTPDGDLIVCATSDEADPHAVPPDPAGPGWAYRGSFPVTQYWRKPAEGCKSSGFKVRVNGRKVYWATHNPIPGGIAYENFDLVEPFCEGQVFVFGITRRSPEEVARADRLTHAIPRP